MTDTPETDKAMFMMDRIGPEVVFAHFARNLETERNKARRELKEAWEEVAGACNDWLNSMVQEPSFEFIKGIRDYAEERAKSA
jgi:hypothetical protein